jgi:hypothetical protein
VIRDVVGRHRDNEVSPLSEQRRGGLLRFAGTLVAVKYFVWFIPWCFGGQMDVNRSPLTVSVVPETSMTEQALSLLLQRNLTVKSDNYPANGFGRFGYYDAEKLARIILNETPEAIEAFESEEEMIEYIRKAMSADCCFISKPSFH